MHLLWLAALIEGPSAFSFAIVVYAVFVARVCRKRERERSTWRLTNSYKSELERDFILAHHT